MLNRVDRVIFLLVALAACVLAPSGPVAAANSSPPKASTSAQLPASSPASSPEQNGHFTLLGGAVPEGSGGGPIPLPTDEITQAQRDVIRENIRESVERLRVEGRLIEASTEAAGVLFNWPLRIAPGLDDPGHHGISNFVDHNSNFPSLLLDYNCGGRTYDTSGGYNHAGTDFFTWPWGWLRMDRNEVQVVAGAAGQIVLRSDGNFDRNCSLSGGNWNAVYVRHADGSVAWYGHMKNGSVTPKQVGDLVARGEYLGIVGSSGNSTGPHLHFEAYDAGNRLIDPWQGVCNGRNPDSWWTTQQPYYDSAVNRVTTGDGAPVLPACPTAETPNARVTFSPGSLIYFTTYYRDQLASQSTTYTLYRPNGSIYSQWTHSSGATHYAASYWYWWFTVGELPGVWRFTASYLTQTVERFFTIGSPQGSGRVPGYPVQGQLLSVAKSGSQVTLAWGPSCLSSDSDYVVYEGAMGDFSSHLAVFCSSGGTLSSTFTPGPGGRYYLVAPRNNSREGSLGTRSDGTPRPEGPSPCMVRVALACP